MADRIHVGILGAMGRMGQELVQAVLKTKGLDLAAGSEREDHRMVGGAIPGTDAPLFSKAKDVFKASDVVIDFTSPGNTAVHAALAGDTKTALIVGTTGISKDDDALLDEAGNLAVIIQAGNMSMGVNLLTALTRRVAKALDNDWDIEVYEAHHRNKVDAPSGTALMLGEAAAAGRGVNHDDVCDRGRDGLTGARKRGAIGYSAMRGGGIVGEHTVGFYSENERLELSHRAENRGLFASGAMKAALWSKGQKNGRYDMLDVLGIV
ncbi:4-hydroxy-tetrahydrodipicolinate reductase [Temperatibacter marinus]|uniref:4-hydroxy-tetrahydrodipicolinate reductase n=1 Tax=Temperatibacter marinus TaxID=1456591 RepID=A0AA52HA54_9PROT|nr:4-hydroxy-tetrahydrodipicolinate reductase [Temperatibacter marinus]WND03624.1 4-hydroxy-tetrahydrodipicolinate reductase [Temperatibacter marinus]